MDVTQPAASALSPASTPAAERAERPKIASDFETFLRMLTVQMQNQDPLNPLQSSEFAVQLATFSGVEQQVRTNDLLSTLATTLSLGGLAQITPWVGLEARAPTAAEFSGQPVDVFPGPLPADKSASLIVRDASGKELQRLPLNPAEGPVQWAGTDADGQPFPPGNYSFFVEIEENGQPVETYQAQVYARIAEVRLEGERPVAVFRNGEAVPADKVTALRSPSG